MLYSPLFWNCLKIDKTQETVIKSILIFNWFSTYSQILPMQSPCFLHHYSLQDFIVQDLCQFQSVYSKIWNLKSIELSPMPLAQMGLRQNWPAPVLIQNNSSCVYMQTLQTSKKKKIQKSTCPNYSMKFHKYLKGLFIVLFLVMQFCNNKFPICFQFPLSFKANKTASLYLLRADFPWLPGYPSLNCNLGFTLP